MTLFAERPTEQVGPRAPRSPQARRSPARRSPQPAQPGRSRRDAGIDAARAACLVVVFVLHAMMVGVTVGPDGPVLENAMEQWDGFAAATWIVQVMPLFFVIGGYAGWTAWQSMRARGGTAAEFVRARVERLVRPAIALVVAVGAALGLLALAGVPAEVVATAGFRIGQPLWFLAVYLACTALVPMMVRAHERRPIATLAGLATVVVSVDALRVATGIEAIGFANLLFVWLLVQQLGFVLAQGHVDRMPRRARLLVAGAALALLFAITHGGPYTPDLFQNLNPPTAALVVLGVVQLMLFSLVRARLRRWAERPRPAALVARFGEWGMTLYLWHLPAFVALAAALLVAHQAFGLELPDPVSPEWWASRPAWLVGAAVVTAMLVRVFARYERGSGTGPRAVGVRLRVRVPLGVAVVAGIVGVGVALVIGFAPLPALLSVALLAVALAGARRAVPAVGAQPTRNSAIVSASERGSHR
ncbi:acyltransferase family protein [Agromyces sp. CFH 90414]|uniref:Acyltransferase family protein n=1 Tax=Agromyces agglutinans TaxID=2662258 RepID=A0A6I2FD42_9MICO|nr:acyltransferase [Agromyces agglutinans]MRG60406.1 acyltransferase family protein [Agromyces agglutinans]